MKALSIALVVLASLALVGGLTYVFVLAPGFADIEAASRGDATAMTLQTLAQGLDSTRIRDRAYPDSLDALLAIPGFAPSDLNDAWGTRVRYTHEGSTAYTLTSAGPDGRFDTADDVVKRHARRADPAPPATR